MQFKFPLYLCKASNQLECSNVKQLEAAVYSAHWSSNLVDCDCDFNNCLFSMISGFRYTRRNFISEY